MAQNKDLVADAQTLLQENLSEKKSVESARRLECNDLENNHIFFLSSTRAQLQCWFHLRLRFSNGLANITKAIFFISGDLVTNIVQGGRGAGKNCRMGFPAEYFGCLVREEVSDMKHFFQLF